MNGRRGEKKARNKRNALLKNQSFLQENTGLLFHHDRPEFIPAVAKILPGLGISKALAFLESQTDSVLRQIVSARRCELRGRHSDTVLTQLR